jgi:hypothetical protein
MNELITKLRAYGLLDFPRNIKEALREYIKEEIEYLEMEELQNLINIAIDLPSFENFINGPEFKIDHFKFTFTDFDNISLLMYLTTGNIYFEVGNTLHQFPANAFMFELIQHLFEQLYFKPFEDQIYELYNCKLFQGIYSRQFMEINTRLIDQDKDEMPD